MKIKVIKGDITKMDVDAIVNAANPALAPGGGVCGAIHKAAGPELAEACKEFTMGCHTGDAVITPGFQLTARYVIHAVGPIYHNGQSGESILLGRAYRRSLDLAFANGLKTIAFPAISTGIYGYPLVQATYCALAAMNRWDLETIIGPMMTVYLVAFDEPTADTLRDVLKQFPQFL